jgi:hypothetical protein
MVRNIPQTQDLLGAAPPPPRYRLHHPPTKTFHRHPRAAHGTWILPRMPGTPALGQIPIQELQLPSAPPPQTPKHLLLSCPEYRAHRTELRHELKLHRNRRLNLETILYTPSGTKALSTLISATKIATAEWANTKLSKTPAEEDTPASLTTGWGTLLEDGDEHEAIHNDL